MPSPDPQILRTMLITICRSFREVGISQYQGNMSTKGRQFSNADPSVRVLAALHQFRTCSNSVFISRLLSACSKVRRCVDVPCRVVVLIQGALKGVRGSAPGTGLLLASDVAHKLVTLFLVLLAAPDLPCHNEQARCDGEASDAHYDADNGRLELGRHSGGLRGGRAILQRSRRCAGSRCGGIGGRDRLSIDGGGLQHDRGGGRVCRHLRVR